MWHVERPCGCHDLSPAAPRYTDLVDDAPLYRELIVPERAAGLRLDRMLALWFTEWSRTELARGIAAGEVTDGSGRALRRSHRVSTGEELRVFVPGIAPSGPPPPHPTVLHEDASVLVLDKPAGLVCHPNGQTFRWSVIHVARARLPDDHVDLAHRLDRDTSGALVLTRTLEANRALKASLKRGDVHKEYVALCRGVIGWDRAELDGPIGAAGGPIRIEMAVRPDGLPARTEVVVEARGGDWTRVRCVLHTGRTHQIRVHLAHAGFPLVGDRLYGVPPALALRALEEGVDDEILAAAGGPRHLLHSHRVRFEHPDGGAVDVEAPVPVALEGPTCDRVATQARAPRR